MGYAVRVGKGFRTRRIDIDGADDQCGDDDQRGEGDTANAERFARRPGDALIARASRRGISHDGVAVAALGDPLAQRGPLRRRRGRAWLLRRAFGLANRRLAVRPFIAQLRAPPGSV